MIRPEPSPRWRRRHYEDVSEDVAAEQLKLPAHRQLQLTFHPMKASTLVTITTTDWQGHRRWDRRNGTMILGPGLNELHGLDLAELLRLLLREALENLS